MAGFQDQTGTWFNAGEDPDVIAQTEEVHLQRPRRWLRVLGACLAVALAAALVIWFFLGREKPSRAAPVLATVAASTPQAAAPKASIAAPTPAPAPVVAPTQARERADKP